jgi:hypothetical protein
MDGIYFLATYRWTRGYYEETKWMLKPLEANVQTVSGRNTSGARGGGA